MDVTAQHAQELLLSTSWTLYAHSAESDVYNYKLSYFQIMDVVTVFDWIAATRHVKHMDAFCTPNAILRVHGHTIHSVSMFQKGILPEWEDAHNKDGITLSLKVLPTTFHGSIDLWNSLVMTCVSGKWNASITGIQCTQKRTRRPHVLRFDVWLAQTESHQECLRHLNSLVTSPLCFERTPRSR